MARGARYSELQALRWARRALQASSREEALWWAAQAYALAPTAPAIRAVIRRIRKRCPNVRGHPPVRRPRWIIAVGFIYGLLMVMALALIVYGLAGWDAVIEEEPPIPIPVAEDSEGADLSRSIGGMPHARGAVALPSATPSPIPTHLSPPPSTAPPPTATPTRVSVRNPRSPASASSQPRSVASPTPTRRSPSLDRWILVDLSEQELIAYQGKTPLLRTKVSTGRARTPTVVGTFRIYRKLRAQTMTGPGYRLPNVPYVMYFYQGYALHGTYWHNNFGRPMSHGCVNLPTPIAEQLYQWADIGTLVVVQP